MTCSMLARGAVLLGCLSAVVAPGAGPAAAAESQAGPNGTAEPGGSLRAIRIVPESGWHLRWQLIHAVERQSLLPGLPGFRHDTVAVALEGGRRLTWEGPGVTWKAAASLRAMAVLEREMVDGAQEPGAPPMWEVWVGAPAFGLAALTQDPFSGRAVEVAAEWSFNGAEPGEQAAMRQVLGVTFSRVIDPAIVAASVALGANAGLQPSAALSAAGECRFVAAEELALYAGASLGVTIPAGQVSGGVWAGVALKGSSGNELALALQRPLDRPGEYGWQVDVRLPGSSR